MQVWHSARRAGAWKVFMGKSDGYAAAQPVPEELCPAAG